MTRHDEQLKKLKADRARMERNGPTGRFRAATKRREAPYGHDAMREVAARLLGIELPVDEDDEQR